jgi:urease accessory protein UreE
VLRSRRLRGKSASLGDEETVGGDAKRGVVVKAAPASTLIMAEANFSFEFLVVPLDPPASLRAGYKLGNRRVGWQRLPASISQVQRRLPAIQP